MVNGGRGLLECRLVGGVPSLSTLRWRMEEDGGMIVSLSKLQTGRSFKRPGMLFEAQSHGHRPKCISVLSVQPLKKTSTDGRRSSSVCRSWVLLLLKATLTMSIVVGICCRFTI